MAAAKTSTTKKEETIVQAKDKLLKLNIELKGVKAKLQTARIALTERGLKKSGKNTFANFDFFQLVDFLPEAQKLFTQLGLTTQYTILPKVIAYEEVFEGEKIYRKPIIRDIASLTIYDIQSDESITFEMEAAPVQIGNNTKQNIYQAAGGRSTYYKRYLYRDALEIEESDESDAVLGASEVNYQTYETAEGTQPVPVQPQSKTIQEVVVNNAPTQDIGQQVEVNNVGNVEPVNPNGLLSIESKGEIMNMILGKGLDGFTVINKFCATFGIVPANLLEKHKQPLIDYVNSL